MKKHLLSILFTFLCCALYAEDTQWDFGGELRLRYVNESGVPNSPTTTSSDTDYSRIRSRLWGSVERGRFSALLRIGNEFRYYFSPDSQKGNRRFPDQTFIDLLYFDVKDIVDGVDLRIGRQEMKFGEGRIINDGVGGDGSRTAYFDAVKFTFDFGSKRTLDAFGIYMARHDWMPTLGHRHDPRSADTKSYDYDITGSNHVEYGLGLYYQDRSCEDFGWDAYYIYKGEHGSKSTAIRRHPKLRGTNEDNFGWHTIGVRLLPRLSDNVTGEIETALQVGDESLFAGMVYSGLTYSFEAPWKPSITGAVLYLSGDHHGNRGSHAWHPVFSNNSDPGDTLCGLNGSDASSNLLYPHVALKFKPGDEHTFKFMTGPVFLPSSQWKNDSALTSHSCGYHAQVSYSWEMGKTFESSVFNDLTFSFFIDYLRKGASFSQEDHDDAVYAQAQFLWRF